MKDGKIMNAKRASHELSILNTVRLIRYTKRKAEKINQCQYYKLKKVG